MRFQFLPVVLFSLISIRSWAQGTETIVKPTKDVAQTMSPHQFNLGFKTTQFFYEEPGYMKDTGWLSGIAGSYNFRFLKNSLWRTESDLVTGNLNYDGALKDKAGNRTPHTSQQRFMVFNISSVWLQEIVNSDSTAFALFGGLGFRDTFDGKDEVYDYRRDITYTYLPLGAQVTWHISQKSSFILGLEHDVFLGGQAKTYFSDVDANASDISPKLTSGSADGGSLQFASEFEKQRRWTVELSYKKWEIADSTTEPLGDGRYGREPRNVTTLTSLAIGVTF